ncbi:MAG: hypothetical protein V2I33_19595 [Kangiellaceae bacterium]|jgi:septin family protein|nr:hypothetical protein [Kangiellaceae bacterium]
MEDTRIHICVFLVEGPEATANDLYAMAELSRLVSIVPVIAKSDLYTDASIIDLKRTLGH